MLKDDDDYVRYVVLDTLGEVHAPHAIPAVRKLLNDPFPDVRKAAVTALEKLGDKPPPASQPGKP
jgi:HEAT repeat protein